MLNPFVHADNIIATVYMCVLIWLYRIGIVVKLISHMHVILQINAHLRSPAMHVPAVVYVFITTLRLTSNQPIVVNMLTYCTCNVVRRNDFSP